MSILGDLFGVVIDVAKIPVAIIKDAGEVMCGEVPTNTVEQFDELGKDLRDL